MTPAIPISADFLERLRRRDPDALAEAVHEHARPLLRAARALGFPEPETEDMVQNVFRTFLERPDNFEGRSQLRTGYSASCTERHWSGAELRRWMIAWTPLMRSSSPDSTAKATGLVRPLIWNR